MNKPQNIMLSDRSQTQETRYPNYHMILFHFLEISRKDKFREIESRSLVAQGWKWEWGLTANRYKGTFRIMEIF